jgi:hypothetical protein
LALPSTFATRMFLLLESSIPSLVYSGMNFLLWISLILYLKTELG